MLIVGAKGLAKEVMQIFYDNKEYEELAFYDDISKNLPEKLFGKYQIITNNDDVRKYFSFQGKNFTIGVGVPVLRKRLYDKFTDLGGVFTSSISKQSTIGNFDVIIGEGCNIFSGVKISNSVSIGRGCIVYYNAVITHDCRIGDFVEISPSANLLGRVGVGDFSHVGANTTILPDIQIGKKCYNRSRSCGYKECCGQLCHCGCTRYKTT